MHQLIESNNSAQEARMLETQQHHTDRVIEQLHSQVELLQTRNEELEKRLLLRPDTLTQSGPTDNKSSRVERTTQCDLVCAPSTRGRVK